MVSQLYQGGKADVMDLLSLSVARSRATGFAPGHWVCLCVET
jgi:hypothetical protein